MTTFVLPGMGATSEMYLEPWSKLQDAVFVDWPPYEGESTLRDVASRLIEVERISRGDFVVGSSLGGMLALEIAALLNLRQVVLIGSARKASEVNVFLRLAAPLAPLTPLGLSQVLGGISSGNIGRMFQQADPDFVVAMSLAVAQWEGVGFPRECITRIHGSRDLTIPCPDDVDVVIKGGGHLVAYSHPSECVSAIEQALRNASGGASSDSQFV